MEAQDSSLDAHTIRVLEDHREELLARIVGRLTALGGAYAAIPGDELAAAASGMVDAAIGVLAEQRGPEQGELEHAAFLGELRARQGVPLDQVLRAVQISAREALDLMGDVAGPTGLDAPRTIALTVRLWDWIDVVSAHMAQAHRRVELANARRDQQQRVSFVHALVTGTLGTGALEEAAAGFGLDPRAQHVVVCVRPDAAHPPEVLERLLLPSTWSVGLTAQVGEDLLAVLPAEAAVPTVPVTAGIGSAVALPALPRSHRDALRARETAAAFGRAGAHRLEDLVLPAAVLAEETLTDILVARHVTPLRELGAFGEDLLDSLRAYLAHDFNVEAAARELGVHANTLRHRLARAEETTGASLRRAESLAEVWWALTADAQSLS